MTKKKSPSEVSARQKALDLLARRDYSTFELGQRLRAAAFESDEIERVLTDFAAAGWLSDERFASQVVANRTRQHGSRRIAQELREKGVPAATIDAALAARENSDAAVAQALWERRFGTAPATAQEKARQVRYLQSRGFSLGLIFRIIGGSADEDAGVEDE